MATPKRPEFFSPITPEEKAILAEWDRLYGGIPPGPTPPPSVDTGGRTSGYYQSLYDFLLNTYGRDAATQYASNPSGAFDSNGNFQIYIGNRSIQIGKDTLPAIIGSNPVVTNPPTTPPPTTTPPPSGGPPIAIDPSFPNVPAPGPGLPLPAGRANPYGAITSLLPGYGLSQQLGSPQHGFGIPGFEDTPTKAGGSWAGTTFMPNLATTLRQNALPETDFYAEYRARHGVGSTSGPAASNTGTRTGTGAGTSAGGGVPAPDGSGRLSQPGFYWAYTNTGGEGGSTGWVELPIPGYRGGVADEANQVMTSAGGTANPRRNWLGVPITNEGWAINQAVPYQTSWYLSTYGGKPPPYINVHEQIGKSMEGVPPALPTFNWAGPNAMAAAQPYAVGMPPGGWTQMLGFNPGGGR